MATYTYREPGAFLTTISEATNTAATTPAMIPLFIGTSADYAPVSTIMIRDDADSRVDPSGATLSPNQDCVVGVQAEDIITIGFVPEVEQFTFSVEENAGTDCYVQTKNVSVGGAVVYFTILEWSPEGLEKVPNGARLYVTSRAKITDETIHLFNSYEEARNYYGPLVRIYDDVANSTKVNNLMTAIWLAFENGAPQVYGLNVIPGNSGIVNESLSEAYARQLREQAFFEVNIWRICPVDCPVTDTTNEFKQINLEVDKHIRQCSAYEERKERCAVYGYTEYNPSFISSYIDNMMAYARSKKYSRVNLVYPYQISSTLPTYGYQVLGPQFLAAAYAGLEAGMPGYQPRTRSELAGIDEILGIGALVGPRLTREEYNRLASGGIMIIEQDGANSVPRIRHQLTTNMDSVETRETSILSIKDFVAKTLRNVCEGYVGRYNISADMITRLKGSVDSALMSLIADGWILEGEIGEDGIVQDTENPDKLFITVSISVPYPCNTIEITLYVS